VRLGRASVAHHRRAVAVAVGGNGCPPYAGGHVPQHHHVARARADGDADRDRGRRPPVRPQGQWRAVHVRCDGGRVRASRVLDHASHHVAPRRTAAAQAATADVAATAPSSGCGCCRRAHVGHSRRTGAPAQRRGSLSCVTKLSGLDRLGGGPPDGTHRPATPRLDGGRPAWSSVASSWSATGRSQTGHGLTRSTCDVHATVAGGRAAWSVQTAPRPPTGVPA
jgi:hypothetical protein